MPKRKPPEHVGNDLGIALVILRTIRGLTQQELADRAGIRAPSISDYELGKMHPGLPRLQQMLDAMHFPLSTLQETQRFIASVRRDPIVLGQTAGEELPADLQIVAQEIGRVSAQFAQSIFLLLQRSDRASGCPTKDQEPSSQDARARAAVLWKELSKRSAKEQARLLAENSAFHRWALCELLCKESIVAAGRDPKQAVVLADFAVIVARAVSGHPPSRLLGYALAHLANALRVGGNLPEAIRTMQESEALWTPALDDASEPLSDAVVYALRASLKRTQGQFAEAVALHDLALASSGGEALRVEILVSKAYTLDESGDLPGMVGALEEASSHLAKGADPRLLFSIRHNLLDALSKAGCYQEAQALLPEVKRLAASGGSDIDFARLQWIEGRIAAGLGNFEEAVPLLLRARGAFMSEGIALDAALVTLELAAVYLAQGRANTVRDLARNLASLFKAQTLPRETLAALQLFRKAAERETVTAELVDRLLVYLRKTRYNPQLRFEE